MITALESIGAVPDKGDNKVVEDSLDPIDLLKNPGWPTLLVLAVLLVLVLLVILVIRLVRCRKRRK